MQRGRKVRFTETSTPAILRCDYGPGETEWKVSPHGPDLPDREASWCETRGEAVEECERLVIERNRLRKEI